MGLRFDKSSAQWSYSGFHAFRHRLADDVDIPLANMQGFHGPSGHGLPWDMYDDDIVPLLNHSDSEGVLTADEMRRVSPRLRELVTAWDGAERAFDRHTALQLCDDMDALLEKHGDEAVLEFR